MSALLPLIIAGFFAGLIGALGLGGGGVLVMFLTVFAGVGQLKAQGINLLFFIPVGLFALYFHIRAKLVIWRVALPAIAAGLIGAFLGALLTGLLGADVVRVIFGIMLLVLGAWELFLPHKPKSSR